MTRVEASSALLKPSASELPAAGELVATIAQSMRKIAQLYSTSLDDPRLDADMLLGLLYLGKGAPRHELEPALALVVFDASDVLDRLLAAGFIESDEDQMLRPTAEAQSLFRRLSLVAQRENAAWRTALQTQPIGSLLLDDFLAMLQHSS